MMNDTANEKWFSDIVFTKFDGDCNKKLFCECDSKLQEHAITMSFKHNAQFWLKLWEIYPEIKSGYDLIREVAKEHIITVFTITYNNIEYVTNVVCKLDDTIYYKRVTDFINTHKCEYRYNQLTTSEQDKVCGYVAHEASNYWICLWEHGDNRIKTVGDFLTVLDKFNGYVYVDFDEKHEVKSVSFSYNYNIFK